MSSEAGIARNANIAKESKIELRKTSPLTMLI